MKEFCCVRACVAVSQRRRIKKFKTVVAQMYKSPPIGCSMTLYTSTVRRGVASDHKWRSPPPRTATTVQKKKRLNPLTRCVNRVSSRHPRIYTYIQAYIQKQHYIHHSDETKDGTSLSITRLLSLTKTAAAATLSLLYEKEGEATCLLSQIPLEISA